MELPVYKPVRVEDGRHEGVVIAVEERKVESVKENGEPLVYLDVVVETLVQGQPVRLRYGCRAFASPRSKLGKLLARFGVDLDGVDTVDPEKVLVGRRVEFLTMTEESPEGSFARIVEDSLKPLGE